METNDASNLRRLYRSLDPFSLTVLYFATSRDNPNPIGEKMSDLSWLPAVGSSAASLLVMAYFLKYIQTRDHQVADLIQRIDTMWQRGDDHLESLKNDFLSGLSESRSHNMEITQALLTVNKDAASTMALLSQKVSDLGSAIGKLTERVDIIDRNKK